MLIQLKNKQRKIASVSLSVFIGSWLLLLCQTCFATNGNIRNHNGSSVKVSSPCHTLKNADLKQTSAADDKHCLGACDCHTMTATVSSDKSFKLKEKVISPFDLYAYITPEIIISTQAPPNYRISTIPERAIFLPVQAYNVLLI